jgi:cytoskeletal protein CcmA (bactofilin family)
MSLLNLKTKTKTEPKYSKKILNSFDDDLPSDEALEKMKDVKITSALIIGEGATINGTIQEKNQINIQGSVDGDVTCKELIVGKSGNLKGKIKTESLSVEGTVEGELNVKGLLKLMSSGSVSGKITYGSLQINEGGKLIGEIDFKDKNILQEEFKDFKAL